MICSIDGCTRPVRARGVCAPHYKWHRRRGIHVLLPLQRPPEEVRFWERVDVVPACCWNWVGGVSDSGYPYFYRDDQHYRVAHRYAWELLVGPIPEGLQLDHLCRNRRCVNPDHLEPVTALENLRRSPTATTLNARKKVCIRGHDDWGHRRTGRYCRTCVNEQKRARRAAQKRAA